MSTSTVSDTRSNHLHLLFQYTVEAYKTFEKLGEKLPNPMLSQMFGKFAVEERGNRDLIDIKYLTGGTPRMHVTLAGDLRFDDMLEGDLGPRETLESLIMRERTMQKKLEEAARDGVPGDRNLLLYLAATKRAHIVLLERELEMVRNYPDWFDREDAEDLIVHGEPR